MDTSAGTAPRAILPTQFRISFDVPPGVFGSFFPGPGVVGGSESDTVVDRPLRPPPRDLVRLLAARFGGVQSAERSEGVLVPRPTPSVVLLGSPAICDSKTLTVPWQGIARDSFAVVGGAAPSVSLSPAILPPRQQTSRRRRVTCHTRYFPRTVNAWFTGGFALPQNPTRHRHMDMRATIRELPHAASSSHVSHAQEQFKRLRNLTTSALLFSIQFLTGAAESRRCGRIPMMRPPSPAAGTAPRSCTCGHAPATT